MRSRFTNLRPFALGLAVCALFFAASAVARANWVQFAGYTNGCIGANCTPTANNSGYQPAFNAILIYNNASFSGTAVDGSLALNGPGLAGTRNLNNLGSFTRGNQPVNPTGLRFTLLVTFTAPPVLPPQSYQGYFTATLRTAGGSNPWVFDFDNTPQLFHFFYTDGQGREHIGGFLLSVNDVSLGQNSTVPLTGQITDVSDTAHVGTRLRHPQAEMGNLMTAFVKTSGRPTAEALSTYSSGRLAPPRLSGPRSAATCPPATSVTRPYDC
jgi:hypothetical protein